MSYINKNSFEIVNAEGLILNNPNRDDYFEVDESIALSISLLNKKGYVTKYCCAGHVYPSEFKRADTQEFIFLDTCNCYIVFTNDYDFKNLPEGFIFDKLNNSGCRIEYEFQTELSTIQRFIEINTANINLYNWVIDLPSIV